MGNRVCVWVRAVVNHGVDEELVERVFAQNRAFFDLPAEQKRLILADCNNRRARHAWHALQALFLCRVLKTGGLPYGNLTT